MRLYVGNLPFKATEAEVGEFFTQAGVTVDSVNIVRDRFSGEARGFGFVEIADEQEAGRAISNCNGKQMMGRAISNCNGKQMMGRALIVNEARPLSNAAGPRGSGSGSPTRREHA